MPHLGPRVDLIEGGAGGLGGPGGLAGHGAGGIAATVAHLLVGAVVAFLLEGRPRTDLALPAGPAAGGARLLLLPLHQLLEAACPAPQGYDETGVVLTVLEDPEEATMQRAFSVASSLLWFEVDIAPFLPFLIQMRPALKQFTAGGRVLGQ